MLLLCLLAFTPALAAPSIAVGDVARVYLERWEQPSHPHIEFLKIEGVWYQLSIGADGFAALPTNADVDALITAILSLPLGDVQYAQPAGLDLNSLDDTATTIGATPVLFCATLTTVIGQYYSVCDDQDSAGNKWAAVADSEYHLIGYQLLYDDSAVFAALQGL
jgi:hypothetical protein